MSYRSILVQVDHSDAGRLRIAAAASLAGRFKASMTGVFLKSEILPSYMIGDGFAVMPTENIEQFMEERDQATAKAMSAARHAFDCAARDVEAPFHWSDAVGDDPQQLVACARLHDLTLLPAAMQPFYGAATVTAQQVAMASGGPVLVLPDAGYAPTFGRRILFPWKETRESARVLRDAWPFLNTAEEVRFLTVSRDADAEFDSMLERNLRAHGCKNPTRVVDRTDTASTSDVIRRHAASFEADMIVLGLYGHSRLQEFVLGGVSRDLLANLPAPLLVSH